MKYYFPCCFLSHKVHKEETRRSPRSFRNDVDVTPNNHFRRHFNVVRFLFFDITARVTMRNEADRSELQNSKFSGRVSIPQRWQRPIARSRAHAPSPLARYISICIAGRSGSILSQRVNARHRVASNALDCTRSIREARRTGDDIVVILVIS